MAVPTLALIPAAQGSKFYSVLPSNGVGDFDFTRASTATRVNSKGLIEEVASGVSRLDYTGGGCPHHLLEPQSTTILAYTNSFTDSLWNKQGTTISSNSIIGLDGALSASVLARGAGVLQRLNQNINLVIGNYYTISCYAKADADIYLSVGLIYSAGNYAGSQFNLNTGVVTRTAFSGANYNAFNPKIESNGNGWYRCSVTVQTGVVNSFPSFVPSDTLWTGSAFNVTNVGDGINGLFIQRTMMTNSLFLSSYISNTTSGTTTRLAETATGSGDADTFNDSEGVLYVEMNAFDNTSRISLSDGSASNRVSFKITDGNIDFQYRVGGIYSYRVDVNVDNSNTNKIAMSFNNGVFVGYLNGVAIGSPISGASLGQGVLDRLNFNDGGSSDNFYGNVKDLRVYNTALTSLEIETLTSYSSFNEMALNFNYTI